MYGARVISPDRASAPTWKRVWNAVINHSMWLYGFLIVLDLIAWRLFATGRFS